MFFWPILFSVHIKICNDFNIKNCEMIRSARLRIGDNDLIWLLTSYMTESKFFWFRVHALVNKLETGINQRLNTEFSYYHYE